MSACAISKSLLVLASVLFFQNSWGAGVPACLDDHGQALPINNQNVLQMKTSTPNSFHARANVSGVVIKLYSDATCHHHFELQIGPGPTDTIEIIYNEQFGKFPSFTVGAKVVACGDYITSNRQTQFPASPDGAIIHWVHISPDLQRHPSGFLMINGNLTGQSIGGGGQNCGGNN